MEVPLYLCVCVLSNLSEFHVRTSGLSTRCSDCTFREELKLLSRFHSSSSDLQGKKKSSFIRSPFSRNRVERTDGVLALASSFVRRKWRIDVTNWSTAFTAKMQSFTLLKPHHVAPIAGGQSRKIVGRSINRRRARISILRLNRY